MKPFIVIFFFLKNHAESLLIGGLEKKFPWISIIIGEKLFGTQQCHRKDDCTDNSHFRDLEGKNA